MGNQKDCLMGVYLEHLIRYHKDKRAFLDPIVAVDETWCQHFQPVTKSMSQEWRHPSSRTPKKAQSSAMAGKVLLSLFFDVQGPYWTLGPH
ncbi:hypothetical protein AVEN_83891-1 [Araneus ventricosus]|uniref:Uncharacterized protein n=1 Tax=Araneus ventricosus TaxID=182803 RepID=A0A4Y2N4G2_ARAVE|nr:hypothetical protein AVEN_83891-1 [Araneus ventricosus]